MKKLLATVWMISVAGVCIATPLFTYNAAATLNGTIKMIRSTHPNPQFNGEKQPAITLAIPISVCADPADDTTETENNVHLIQLSAGTQDMLYAQLLPENGKKATVKCTDLFHGLNGHHTTKVLGTIDSVKFK